MRSEGVFPPGFDLPIKAKIHRDAVRQKEPICSVGRSGYLTFNQRAAEFLRGPGDKNRYVLLAWNPVTKVMGVRPSPSKPTKSGLTYFRMIVQGSTNQAVTVSFKSMSKQWGIPTRRTRYYHCELDPENGILYVNLGQSLGERG